MYWGQDDYIIEKFMQERKILQSDGKFRPYRPLIVRFGDSIGQFGSRDYYLRMPAFRRTCLSPYMGLARDCYCLLFLAFCVILGLGSIRLYRCHHPSFPFPVVGSLLHFLALLFRPFSWPQFLEPDADEFPSVLQGPLVFEL